jgi:ABC-type Fe3+ transport system permease subunit
MSEIEMHYAANLTATTLFIVAGLLVVMQGRRIDRRRRREGTSGLRSMTLMEVAAWAAIVLFVIGGLVLATLYPGVAGHSN